MALVIIEPDIRLEVLCHSDFICVHGIEYEYSWHEGEKTKEGWMERGDISYI